MGSSQRRAATAGEIRAEMARQKIAVAKLAEASGIKEPTLRNRLHGRSPFFLEEVASICTVLGVGLSAFNDRVESVMEADK